MDIAFINEVLVKLQHIQTAVSTQTQTQMIDDGELRSVCDHLRAVCQVVNSDLPPKDMGTCELLIFRKSIYKGGLVNMRSSDLTHIADVLDWFVFIAENKRPHLTQGNSFFAD